MPMPTAVAIITPLVHQEGERAIALAAVKESIDTYDPHAGEDWLIALNRVSNLLAKPGSTVDYYHDFVTLIAALAPYEYDHDTKASRPGVSAVLNMTSLACGPDERTLYLCPACGAHDVVCTAGPWFVEVTPRHLRARGLSRRPCRPNPSAGPGGAGPAQTSSFGTAYRSSRILPHDHAAHGAVSCRTASRAPHAACRSRRCGPPLAQDR
jgi:hypothetical protein